MTTRFCVTVYLSMAILLDISYQVHMSIGGRNVNRMELLGTLLFFCLWLPLIPAIVWMARRYSLTPGSRLRSLEVHFFFALALSLVTLFAHKLVFCPKVWPHYAHCVLYFRAEAWVARWFALDYFIYGAVVAGIWAIDAVEATRRRQLQVSEMERDLAAAELRLITSRIRPDFLIESFRSIAGLVSSEPIRAEKRLSLLADYLRCNVRGIGATDLTVADDLDLARSWIAMEREGVPIEIEVGVRELTLTRHIDSPRLSTLLSNQNLRSTKRLEIREDGQHLITIADSIEIGRVDLETA